LTSSPRCPVDLKRLSDLVSGRVFGETAPKATVSVAFRDTSFGVDVVIRLRDGTQVVGSKLLSAPNCEEAIVATAAVLALALSAQPLESHVELQSDVPREKGDSIELRTLTPQDVTVGPATSELVDTHGSRNGPIRANHAPTWRAALGLGFELGRELAPGVEAALVRRLGAGDLRLSAAYVQPLTISETDAQTALAPMTPQTTDLQYAATSAAQYCHPLVSELWLAMCGGLQLTAARYLLPALEESSAERWAWELGPSMGVLFSGDGGLIQPQAQLAATLPLLAERAGIEATVVRATLGASIGF
jgi:hypothetical protein